MKHLPLSLLVLIGLSACTTPQKTATTAPAQKPSEKVRQDYLKPRDIERVRTGEFVKTYHLGRTVKGRGGSTMHEAHRVYRLEKPSRWSLFRDQPPLASTGPVNRIVDSAFKPAPESNAIQAELTRQRQTSSELEATQTELVDALAKVRSKLTESTYSKIEEEMLQRKIELLEVENAQLRRDQTNAIPLPEKPSLVPGDALKQWGEKIDSKKE